MPHDAGLIANITFGLAFALVGGFLAKRLHLPPILGYLLAGVAVGPHTPGFIADVGIASQLAEIGVILLMFGVGIHFSLRQLLAIRAIAIPGALGQIVAVTALVVPMVFSWGWSLGAGLVFGLALSVASTVVLTRALMDRDALDSVHGHIALGWLIVEDLITVLVLVLLPMLAGVLGGIAAPDSTAFPGDEGTVFALGLTLGKVALFALLMYFVGARAVPWLLLQAAHAGSRELFTLAVLVVALGVAYGSATLFGVSLALGAFLAGVVVGESDLSHQAASDAVPLRDAFAVLFFVSVGMLFNPQSLLTTPGPLLAVLGVIVLAKPLVACLIVFAFGYPVRTGLSVAAGRAQIGEFSFIIAEMGRTLGVLPGAGYDLIVAAAVFSIALNPLLFRIVEPLDNWIRRRPKLSAFLAWRGGAARIPAAASEKELRGHAVLCGYGRVGSVIAQALEGRGFRYVVIEQNRRLVDELRRRGIFAVYGDAANPTLLDHVRLTGARILLIAIPDPPATRQIVEYARRVNPRLDIVTRTHSEAEWAYLREGGRVSEAVLGERELAIEMAGYALRRYGVSAMETLAIMQGLRRRD